MLFQRTKDGAQNKLVIPPLPERKHDPALSPEKISPEVQAYTDHLKSMSVILEEKLKPPLVTMIKDAKGPLSQEQDGAIIKFFNRGREAFAENAIETGKEALSLPEDIDSYPTEGKLAIITVELAKLGKFIDLSPKTVTVKFTEAEITERKENFTKLFLTNGMDPVIAEKRASELARESQLGIFSPRLYQLSEAISGETALQLKGGQKLILPKIEGATVEIPTNANITRRMLLGDNLNEVSLSGCAVSFNDLNGKASSQQIILNPRSINDRAIDSGIPLDDMFNSTLVNEISSIALTEHFGKDLTYDLFHNHFDINLKIGPSKSNSESSSVNLNINLLHLGEIYSDMASAGANNTNIKPILEHFSKRDQYSLISTSIISAILKANNDGLIKLSKEPITAESLAKIFSGKRDLEVKFAEQYLIPEMRQTFDSALKQCKDQLIENGTKKP